MARMVSAAAAALLLLLAAACGTTPVVSEVEGAMPLPALDRAASMSLACSGCHNASGGAVPSLEGQQRIFLRQSLFRYKSETDGTTVMHRMMRGYSDEDIEAISAYLAGDAAS